MSNKKIFSALVIGSLVLMQAPLLVLAQTMPAMETVVPADTTPPVISGVMVASIAPDHATIVWNTDEYATSTLRYGTTENYGSSALVDQTPGLMHTTTLTGLTASTTYFYCIDATDAAGNKAESCGHSFVTADEPTPMDTNPPTITSVTVDPITETGATVRWTTDEVADGYVEYGMTPDFGTETPLVSDYSTDHTAAISGLTAGTEYFYRVVSADETGNTAESTTNSFTTTSPAPDEEPAEETTTPPANEPAPAETAPHAVITNVEVATVTETSVTITWSTDIAASSQIKYGDSEQLGTTTPLDATLKTSHSVTISNLTPNTNYFFKVLSSASGQTSPTVSNLHEFTTLAQPIFASTPAKVSNVTSSGISTTGATVTWTTDMLATSEVQYGLSTAYGHVKNAGTQTSDSHSITLADLAPETVYHYRVKSVNEAGDITYSNDHTFTTLTPVQSAPVNEPAPVSSGGGGSSVSYGGGGSPAHFSPTLLNAAGTDSQITLDWQNSGSDSFAHIVIVRKEGGYPAYPSDGKVVYEGGAETFTDIGLVNGKKYYYGIYAYDQGKIYSVPIHVSLAPEAGRTDIELHKNPVIVPTTPSYHFSEIFKRGDTDIEVRHLQVILAATGEVYPEGHLTGYFGSLTEKALKRFQDMHNLPQTGITDTATQAKLHTASESQVRLSVPENLVVYSTDLHAGHTGEDVGALQRFLVLEGSYKEALVTNYFGSYTRRAVIAFQKKYDIQPAVGYVGPITRHKIQAISGF